jgi:hypothetical protein
MTVNPAIVDRSKLQLTALASMRLMTPISSIEADATHSVKDHCDMMPKYFTRPQVRLVICSKLTFCSRSLQRFQPVRIHLKSVVMERHETPMVGCAHALGAKRLSNAAHRR